MRHRDDDEDVLDPDFDGREPDEGLHSLFCPALDGSPCLCKGNIDWTGDDDEDD